MGSAKYLDPGWRAQAEGSTQAGWSPRGGLVSLRMPFLDRFLIISPPPFTPRLLLPSALVVPILEVIVVSTL